MDIDSQGDGANAVMSGLESESESDCEPEEEFPETQYIHCPEDEFGAVSEFNFIFIFLTHNDHCVNFKLLFLTLSVDRLANKLKNWQMNTKASFGFWLNKFGEC